MRNNLKFTLAIVLWALFYNSSYAGEVKTKDNPKKEGGYYEGSYHLKGKGHEEGYVKRKHKWKNPFSGFGEMGEKPKKQGSMPHSR